MSLIVTHKSLIKNNSSKVFPRYGTVKNTEEIFASCGSVKTIEALYKKSFIVTFNHISGVQKSLGINGACSDDQRINVEQYDTNSVRVSGIEPFRGNTIVSTFERYGPIKFITNFQKGKLILGFEDERDAKDALALDGYDLDGDKIKVEEYSGKEICYSSIDKSIWIECLEKCGIIKKFGILGDNVVIIKFGDKIDTNSILALNNHIAK